MEFIDPVTTDKMSAIPAKASALTEILKAVLLSLGRTTPKTAAPTPKAMKYGTVPNSHSATPSPLIYKFEANRSFC
jgi:hypothetical protein